MSGSLHISDGRIVTVRDGLVLGRVAGCDVVVDDSKCSRRHARMIVQGGVVEIEDLQSSNGTLLNGKPVQKRVLRDGDEIRIGQTALVFRDQVAAGVPTPKGPTPKDPTPKDPTAGPVARTPAATRAPSDEVDLFDDELDDDGPRDDEPAPPPRAESPLQRPTASEPKPEPPSSPRAPATVEFADEVVEVRKARPASTAASGPPTVGEPVIAQKGRVLQFSMQKDSGALGDDLAQMGNGMRSLVVLGVVVLAAGLFWLAMTLMG